ncbi:DUF4238 domain-containing protein [Providencia stuartii]|uniref:DUF4238 domain-containing protein n=1 Tax=Providencia stuartii TaxID=588 RepID=UPI0033211C59
MNKNSIEYLYQHYLPESYLRYFMCREGKRRTAPYAFNKKIAEKNPRAINYKPLRLDKMCGENDRHTMVIDGDREVFIEKSFSELEQEYHRFIQLITKYYSMVRKKFIQEKYCYKHNLIYSLKKINKLNYTNLNPVFFPIYDVDLIKIIKINIRALVTRNKSLDSELNINNYNSFDEMKKKFIDFADTINNKLGEVVIDEYSKLEMEETLNLVSELEDDDDVKLKEELIREFRKIDRYLLKILGDEYFDFDSCDVYLHRINKKDLIIGSDTPFFKQKLNGVVSLIFTLTPNFVLFFVPKSNIQRITNVEKLADLICRMNVKNADEFVFSNNQKKLIKYTEHLVNIT